MPLTKATQSVIEGIVSTGSTGVSAGSFIVGQQYKITSLGTTTQSQWNTIAGTTGQTYVVGSLFTAATNGASSGNGAAAVARTLANRFADVVNVKDFGAVGDGITDNQTAFQAAINAALAAGGGTIYIPKGTYNFPSTSTAAKLDPGLGNLTFKGDGYTSSILKYWEGTGTEQQGNLFSNTTNNPSKSALIFKDLQIQGSLNTRSQSLPSLRFGNPLFLDYYPEVLIDSCKFYNIAAMAMDFHYCGSFKCVNSHFELTAADAVRTRDTNDCIVIGNTFKSVGDDTVALHTATSTLLSFTPQRERIIVSNNIMVNCAGNIRAIGAKKTIISNNNLHLAGQIEVLSNYLTFEGNNPMYDISVTGNIITDSIFGWNNDAVQVPAIMIDLQMAKFGSSTDNIIPGDYNSVTGKIVYPWDNNQTSAIVSSNSIPRANGVVVSNNSISRTKSKTLYTDFGVGVRMWQGFNDPSYTISTVENTLGRGYGIFVNGNVENLVISNNVIKNCLIGIYLNPDKNGITSPETYSKVFKNGVISGNVIYDCIETGIRFFHGSAASFDVHIIGNSINCDPYRINMYSNINGTYQNNNAAPNGIYAFNARGYIVRENKFKNCRLPIEDGGLAGVGDESNNIFYGQPVSPYAVTDNKGIGRLVRGNDENGENQYVIEDSDPTSATYLDFISLPWKTYFQQPASGWYPKGWFVKNYTPTLDANGMTISGWVRLTTGAGHVAGVDWAVARVSNVSPAT